MTQVRTVNIRGKEYVDVAERIRLCHADEGYSMTTQERYEVAGRWFFSITIEVKGKRYAGDAEIKFDAHANTPDGTNPMECAQTSALGRALGFAGYGATESIASADDITHAHDEQRRDPILDVEVKKLKKRALAVGLAHDADEWVALLKAAGAEQIANAADLAKVSTFITGYEQQVKSA